MVRGYTSVSVSSKLIEKIDEALKSGKTTYNSRSDFIKDAIRIRLRELGITI
jgi:Arc/MetJ-type ribon-helix-helix transcriptional regulator